MKNKIAIISLLVISTLACKDVEKLTEFTMEINSSVTIPKNPVSGVPVDISTPDLPTNSEAIFSGKNTRQDLIEEIKLTNMDLKIISPSGSNLDFFKSVSVYMSANGLPEISLATKTDVPDSLTELALDASGSNIKEYLKKNNFSLRFIIETDQAVPQNHDLDVQMVYFVDAKILGQ
ncbi:MAG: hypothetical protein JKY48_15345 [Flavobacteriales bacterium]|nr:hypothetical protein [Flavobacteriales bacterium]